MVGNRIALGIFCPVSQSETACADTPIASAACLSVKPFDNLALLNDNISPPVIKLCLTNEQQTVTMKLQNPLKRQLFRWRGLLLSVKHSFIIKPRLIDVKRKIKFFLIFFEIVKTHLAERGKL